MLLPSWPNYEPIAYSCIAVVILAPATSRKPLSTAAKRCSPLGPTPHRGHGSTASRRHAYPQRPVAGFESLRSPGPRPRRAADMLDMVHGTVAAAIARSAYPSHAAVPYASKHCGTTPTHLGRGPRRNRTRSPTASAQGGLRSGRLALTAAIPDPGGEH